MWQVEQEKVAFASFAEQRNSYETLLSRWQKLFPEKCGKPAAVQGFATTEGITSSPGSRFSLDVDGKYHPDLSLVGLSKQLGAPIEDVLALVDNLRDVKSHEIRQSAATVFVVSPINDTHGILHIDPTCPGSSQFEYDSKREWSDLGHFNEVRSLGNGWFYYVEQR